MSTRNARSSENAQRPNIAVKRDGDTLDTITVTVDHFTEYAVMAQAPAPVAPAPPVAPTLKDIAGSWAQANIEKLVSLGAINGYPDGHFRPLNPTT